MNIYFLTVFVFKNSAVLSPPPLPPRKRGSKDKPIIVCNLKVNP